MIQVGQTAKLVQPVIQGEVKDTQFNKSAGELEHLIAWVDAEANEQERWFLASTLEVVE